MVDGRAMKEIGDPGGGLRAIGHFPAVFHWEGIYLPVSLLLPQHILAVNSCCREKTLKMYFEVVVYFEGWGNRVAKYDA